VNVSVNDDVGLDENVDVEVDVDEEVARWLEKTHSGWTQTESLRYTILRYRYIIPNDLYVVMALKCTE
jgi:hypothetical protein